MSAREELEVMREELALKELEADYQDALDKVHAPSPTEKDRVEYARLKNEFAAARTAFRQKRPAPTVAAGDAVVTPETVAAETQVPTPGVSV